MKIELIKNLVIVRHGLCTDFDEKGHFLQEPALNLEGTERVRKLAELLVSFIGTKIPFILSSSALRARQSAEIIAQRFGTTFDASDFLWTGSGGKVLGLDEHFEAALKVVESAESQVETLVLVAHQECVQWFPEFWGKKIGAVRNWANSEISCATAWFIDCVAKTMKHIKPS